MHRLVLSAGAACLVMLSAPAAVEAGPKGCPPGLAKQGRCAQAGHGTKHAPGLRYRRWDRWRDAGLEPASRGYSYVIIDNRVMLVEDDTSKIIRVIGAIVDLLN